MEMQTGEWCVDGCKCMHLRLTVSPLGRWREGEAENVGAVLCARCVGCGWGVFLREGECERSLE